MQAPEETGYLHSDELDRWHGERVFLTSAVSQRKIPKPFTSFGCDGGLQNNAAYNGEGKDVNHRYAAITKGAQRSCCCGGAADKVNAPKAKVGLC
jgi:hypothetical protein